MKTTFKEYIRLHAQVKLEQKEILEQVKRLCSHLNNKYSDFPALCKTAHDVTGDLLQKAEDSPPQWFNLDRNRSSENPFIGITITNPEFLKRENYKTYVRKIAKLHSDPDIIKNIKEKMKKEIPSVPKEQKLALIKELCVGMKELGCDSFEFFVGQNDRKKADDPNEVVEILDKDKNFDEIFFRFIWDMDK